VLLPYLTLPCVRPGANGTPVKINDAARLEMADLARQLKEQFEHRPGNTSFGPATT
jgi:hypothetical protein